MTNRFLPLLTGLLMAASFLPAFAHNETLTNGTNRDLSQFGGDSGGADGVTDFQISGPASECSNITKFEHLNSSARAFPSTFNYSNMTYEEAIGENYAATGPFCPSDGDLYYVRTAGASTVDPDDDRFYKLRVNTNTSGGANVDYEWLGTGIPSPPDSSFTFTTYDLFGIFTDTSTGSPAAWDWDFGDGGNSTQQNPRHRYGSAATRTVTLTASNVGGADPTPDSQQVAVSERPSTLVAVSGTFDFDSDSTADMQVVSGSGCDGGTNHLETRNGAGVALINGDYRSVTDADIAGQSFSATNFCTSIDYLDAFLVQTGTDNIYKAWIARNDGGGIRLEFELLQAGGPPPPDSSFTFSSYDLIVDFVDTSTGDPASWSWTFGDGGTSSQQNPRYRYASPGTRSACLTAGNAGGDGPEVCQDVTVSQVDSTQIGVDASIDLDNDGLFDLRAQSAGGACGSIANSLATRNGGAISAIGKDYRNIILADADGASFNTGTFCFAVDYFDGFLVRTGSGNIFRAWTASNDGAGIRLEYDLLGTLPPEIFFDSFEN